MPHDPLLRPEAPRAPKTVTWPPRVVLPDERTPAQKRAIEKWDEARKQWVDAKTQLKKAIERGEERPDTYPINRAQLKCQKALLAAARVGAWTNELIWICRTYQGLGDKAFLRKARCGIDTGVEWPLGNGTHSGAWVWREHQEFIASQQDDMPRLLLFMAYEAARRSDFEAAERRIDSVAASHPAHPMLLQARAFLRQAQRGETLPDNGEAVYFEEDERPKRLREKFREHLLLRLPAILTELQSPERMKKEKQIPEAAETRKQFEKLWAQLSTMANSNLKEFFEARDIDI